MNGWLGKILKVDLSAASSKSEELGPEILEGYLGGRGLGVRLLTLSGKHLLDPLSPEAAFIVAAGPLTATRAPGAGRLSLVAVSPLTNTIFDSNSGGFFGPRLKGAGFDALLVEGAADRPTILRISPQGVFFEDATFIKGLGTHEARKALAAEYGAGCATLLIGPAGETGSLMANVAHGGRFFGRGGLGALFGSKNLKAVIVSGDYRPSLFDPELFNFVAGECGKLIAAHPITSKGLKQFGTSVMMNLLNAFETLPVANFRKNTFAGAAKISGEALRDNILSGTHACPGCPIGCGRKVTVDGVSMEGPEFETLWSFGAALERDDLKGIAKLNYLANDLGLDTVSLGSTIASARELFEAGDLSFDPLDRGAEGLAELFTEIAWNRGRGAALRDGSLKLGEALGKSSVSMAVKGLELPAYDPRGCQGQGLAYATSNRGGCHMRSYMVAPEILAAPKQVDRFASSGKAGLVIVSQNLNAATDSLVMCRFMSFALKDDYYARLLRSATGLPVDAQGLMTIGERIYNLERLANIARGFGREDDSLPERLVTEGDGTGPALGRPVRLSEMLEEYYRFRGWDSEGAPSAEKLKALGL